MELSTFISIVSVSIAFLGLAASIYFSSRNSKRADDEAKEKEEERQKKEIESAKKDAERNAEINYKLDAVLGGVNNTSAEIKDIKKEMSTLSKDYVAMSRDMKTLFARMEDTNARVDKVENHLELLHREHREHVGMEDAAHHMFHAKHHNEESY